ncbi:MAG: hypothetical protein WD467_00235 [Candidatus Saccharimonadales bacterium]
MGNRAAPSLIEVREAIEASWSADTAYGAVFTEGNPALGNCYPTSRVVQHFFPNTELTEGIILTSAGQEKHFWNMLVADGTEYHIDLTWQQFPPGSVVMDYEIRYLHKLNDGEDAIRRVELLLSRVKQFIQI